MDNVADQLQGIQCGIAEMAKVVTINKAGGDNIKKSRIAQVEYQIALHLFPPAENGWLPQVVTCSALEQTGIAEIRTLISAFVDRTRAIGSFAANRQQQNLQWMHDIIRQQVYHRFYQQPRVKSRLAFLEQAVQAGNLPPLTAAKEVLAQG